MEPFRHFLLEHWLLGLAMALFMALAIAIYTAIGWYDYLDLYFIKMVVIVILYINLGVLV